MTVREHRQDGIVQIRLEGEDALDCANATRVKAELLRCVQGTEDLVVDLSMVEFVDSAGVGVLVSLFKAARLTGRKATFAGARPGVASVLAIIKLDQIFDLYPDTAAAIQSLGAHARSYTSGA